MSVREEGRGSKPTKESDTFLVLNFFLQMGVLLQSSRAQLCIPLKTGKLNISGGGGQSVSRSCLFDSATWTFFSERLQQFTKFYNFANFILDKDMLLPCIMHIFVSRNQSVI